MGFERKVWVLIQVGRLKVGEEGMAERNAWVAVLPLHLVWTGLCVKGDRHVLLAARSMYRYLPLATCCGASRAERRVQGSRWAALGRGRCHRELPQA